MNQSIKKLSVIVPYYNEEYTILLSAIKKISSFLTTKGICFEIIVSQNGPTKKITLPFSYTKVVYNKKRGLGLAIKKAVSVASGNYCYFLSAQIPFNFTDLKHMLKIYRQYDLVIGSKLHPQSVYKIQLIRYLFSHFISRITPLLIPAFKVRDPNGTLFGPLITFRYLCKKTKSDDFFFGTEIVYLYIKNKLRVCEVPVTYINNKKFHSSVRITDGFKYLFKLISLSINNFISIFLLIAVFYLSSKG